MFLLWKNDETILHLFYQCDLTKSLWQTLRTKFSTLPELNPQSAFFGLHSEHISINHIHLIFRIALYKIRIDIGRLATLTLKYIRSRLLSL